MQVTVENTGNKLERRLRIQVPADRIEREIQERLQSLGKTVRLKGFRPGKAPLKVIRQQYGTRVRNEVLTDMLRASYTEALRKENLNPAGGPRIEDTQDEPGGDFEFTAMIEVYPDIELEEFSGLKFEKPAVEITDDDLERMIESLRRQRATWNTVDRAAREGDQLTVDFDGELDGEPFKGSEGRQVKVIPGSGRFLEAFERNLVGAGAGDELEFDVPFPGDYANAALAGKTVQFKVKVHDVAEQVLPELDDDFCRLFGIEEGGIDRLRTEVRANMQRELDLTVRRKLKHEVLDSLLEMHEIDLPAGLVADEIRRLKDEALKRMGAGSSKDRPDLPDDMFEEQAQRRVSLGLLIGEIIRQKRIKLDRERVDATLVDLASDYESPREVADMYRKEPRIMGDIEAMVMEEQVVDLVLSESEVVDKPAAFDEIMNPEREG